MALTQDQRDMAVSSVLGKDVLLISRMLGREELGRIPQFEYELLSTRAEIDAKDILGSPIELAIKLRDSSKRYIHGHVVRFTSIGKRGSLNAFEATVRPALWFLTLAADCRIFQHKSVVDIIKAVVAAYPSVSVDYSGLSGEYPALEYKVQYRESDFNFISRLMEGVGIYYFLKHESGKHTVMLADSAGAHQPIAGNATIPSRPDATGLTREQDHVSGWTVTYVAETGKYALNDFDFKKFGASNSGGLRVNSVAPRDYQPSSFEAYDYPGGYSESGQGEALARARLDGLQSRYQRIRGKCNVRTMRCGGLFTLSEHPNASQNAEYLLVATELRLSNSAYESGAAGSEAPYTCSFEAIPSTTAFRADPVTPLAVIRGPQTATVVGPSGEEIYTDQYGRVMAQFHWDREGKRDQNAVCWMRVAQDWAGKNWGTMFIPRIGQEVVVDFLEGDPDHPIIVGSVYNSDNTVPYPLPDRMTVSTVKSHSSKGGGGYNELRFEDKKGSEQVYIHAEKDQDNYVKNDSREWVGEDRSLIVVRNQMEKVSGDQSLAVGGDRMESVGGDASVKIGGQRSEQVEGKESLTIGGDRLTKVGGDQGTEVGGDWSDKVGGTVSLKVSQKLQQKVGMDHAVDAGMQIHLKAGMDIVIEAGMEITLKAGGSYVVIGPSGVAIQGAMVMLNSGGAPGSGNGAAPNSPASPAAPTAPKDPDKADDGAS